MNSRISRSERSERVVLFTLVDLLVQIIFFALFLVVLFEQSNEQLSRELELKLLPYSRVAQPELISFIEAVSRLIPLRDVDKEHSIGDRDRAVRDNLIALSTIFSRMKTVDVMKLKQVVLSDVTIEDLQSQSDLLRVMRRNKLTSKEAMDVLSQTPSLDSSESGELLKLNRVFLSMNPKQRSSLLDAALRMEKPICFAGTPAFAVTEVEGGYLVSDPIQDVSQAFAEAVVGLSKVENAYSVSETALDGFGSRLNSAFPSCYIRVRESTRTNNERQYKHLNQYFYLTS